MKKFHSGFVALIGRPNVGKSTLMNCLIGEKIAITSHKPQTTRNKITSILTKDDFQCVFLDTPGIHKPKSKLGEYMMRSAETTFNEVDLVLMLIEPTTEVQTMDEYVLERIKNVKTPVVLVINKIDTVEREALLEVISVYSKAYPFAEVVPISAMKDRNTGELLEVIRKYLPEGPQYFPADMVTDQPERQIASEIIREKALYLLQDEVPHGIAVEIMSMKKRPDKDIVDVQATIYCERDSHKGIIIGKQGAMLKRIGSTARYDMQRLLGSPIYLQLWVKVKKDWRDSDFLLKNFGYDKKNFFEALFKQGFQPLPFGQPPHLFGGAYLKLRQGSHSLGTRYRRNILCFCKWGYRGIIPLSGYGTESREKGFKVFEWQVFYSMGGFLSPYPIPERGCAV